MRRKAQLSLKFSFESVQLELMAGRLTKVKLGNPAGSVTLQCQGQEVAAFRRDITLRLAYHLEPPLVLPGDHAVRAGGVVSNGSGS